MYKTSAAKYWPISSFKISPEVQLQNLDQTLCTKSEQKFNFMTKPQLPNLQQTVGNTILIINISKKIQLSFELASSHARVTSIKSIEQESVSELVSDKGSQWTDSGPIKNTYRCKLTLSKVYVILPVSPLLNQHEYKKISWDKYHERPSLFRLWFIGSHHYENPMPISIVLKKWPKRRFFDNKTFPHIPSAASTLLVYCRYN